MSWPLLTAYALWLVFFFTWHAYGFRSARQVTSVAKERDRAWSLAIVAGWALIVLPPMKSSPKLWTNPAWLEWALLGVVLAGFAFCWWARIHLGSLWSAEVTRREGHKIIESGPYGLVRHPIYTGFLVSYFGVAMLATTATALLALPCFALGLWLKARLEEEFLSEELGAAAYASYKSRTPMLVPRLSR